MVTAMILAGGVSARMGADRPKQFIEIFDKPVLAYTVEIFQRHPEIDAIEIVCHSDWKGYLDNMVQKYDLKKVKWVADGGNVFQQSVINGVNHLRDKLSDQDYILIQYGASPFTSEKIISDVIRVMKEKGNAITATPCYQLMGSNDGSVSRSWVDRDACVQLACPFGFEYGSILDIYRRAEQEGILDKIEPHTTSLMYALGDPIYLAYGDQTNIKITTKEDLELFEGFVLRKRQKGENGFL